jgi:isopenicillin-N epimerase
MPSLRRQFLLDPKVTFLNHGSFGATPKPVFRAYQRWQRELERQPVEFLGRRHNDLMKTARGALAAYLGSSAENVVYTQNDTIALNIVARSLKLGPGDEVLGTDHEYGALDRTWRFLAKERGFTYRTQPIPLPLTTAADFAKAFWHAVTPRTRVIFLSHITSPTALIFPVELIVGRAREAGILTIVDGAHAPGQLPLSLDSLGADFYGGNLHKWLCAPKGAGFLYARPEVQHLLKPLVVSWGYESDTPSGSAFVDYHEWWGTRDIAAFLSAPAAIDFQQTHHWDEIITACHDLAVESQRRICNLTGLAPLHTDSERWFRQMFTAPLPANADILALKTRLYDEYDIEVPFIAWKDRKLIRVSIQAYNSRRDVDRLLRALKACLT